MTATIGFIIHSSLGAVSYSGSDPSAACPGRSGDTKTYIQGLFWMLKCARAAGENTAQLLCTVPYNADACQMI